MNGRKVSATIIGGGGVDSLTGGAGLDALTGGAGNDTFAYTAIGQTFTANAVVDNAFDVISDFTIGEDKIAFSKIANGGASMSFQATGATFKQAYAAGKVYVVETAEANVAAVDGATAGADGGANKVAIVIFNTTAGAINLNIDGVNNDLETTLEAGTSAGLQMFALDATTGQDYGTIAGTSFFFA